MVYESTHEIGTKQRWNKTNYDHETHKHIVDTEGIEWHAPYIKKSKSHIRSSNLAGYGIPVPQLLKCLLLAPEFGWLCHLGLPTSKMLNFDHWTWLQVLSSYYLFFYSLLPAADPTLLQLLFVQHSCAASVCDMKNFRISLLFFFHCAICIMPQWRCSFSSSLATVLNSVLFFFVHGTSAYEAS